MRCFSSFCHFSYGRWSHWHGSGYGSGGGYLFISRTHGSFVSCSSYTGLSYNRLSAWQSHCPAYYFHLSSSYPQYYYI